MTRAAAVVLATVLAAACAGPSRVDVAGPDAPRPPVVVSTEVDAEEWGLWATCRPSGVPADEVPGAEPAAEGIDGVLRLPAQPGGVVTDCPTYAVSPPVGGPRSPEVASCGFHRSPVPDPPAVRALERGAVWITFAPGLPADEVEVLREAAVRASHVLVSPRTDLPAPVVLTAWRLQLAVGSARDPRVDTFLDDHVQGLQAPDLGGACHEGLGDPVDRFR